MMSTKRSQASHILSNEFRRRLAVMSIPELIEVMNDQISETQKVIETLTDEIQIRLMEQSEEE